MSWFDKLKTLLLSGQTVAGIEPPGAHSLSLENSPKTHLDWSSQEIGALLAAEKSAHFCYASHPQYKSPLQSVILGFDLSNNHILLDEFFPCPASGLIDQILTLTLPTILGVLRLEMEISEKVILDGQAAFIAHIRNKAILQDRRQSSRVAFAKDQAPAIELLLPMSPLIHGQVIDLSDNGLLMAYPSPQKPDFFTHSGECKILFNEQFTFKALAKIKQVRFNRKPFRHNLLRISFCALEQEQKDQLQMFIHRYQSCREAVSSAA